jgi:hypothetical protein
MALHPARIQRKRTKTTISEDEARARGLYVRTRLRLDDALEKQDNFDGWSPARIRAFQSIDTNPNSYYYRFNAPGEAQCNGGWNEEETRLFYERMHSFGVNKNWGLFSMTIPGRVGYQCSNFYRKLIESNKVSDDNYYLDERGRARFKSRRASRDASAGVRAPSKPKAPAQPRKAPAPKPKSKKKKKKRRRRNQDVVYADDVDSSDSDSDSGDTATSTSTSSFSSSSSSRRRDSAQSPMRSAASQRRARLENPLPGVMDPITMEEVVKPCMSPFGHVMG